MRDAKWFGRPALLWLTLGAAGFMVLGGFGPWATVLGLATVSGTRGDGWFIILGGLAAAVLVWRNAAVGARWSTIATLVVGLIGAAVAISDLSDINGLADTTILGDVVDPGWGLYASLLGSLGLALFAGLTLAYRPFAPPAVVAEPAPDSAAA